MKTKGVELRCIWCRAFVTIDCENILDITRRAGTPSAKKLKCPICGAFLYPKEIDKKLPGSPFEKEAYHFSSCPLAEKCRYTYECYSPECESGKVSKMCIHCLMKAVESAGNDCYSAVKRLQEKLEE